MGGGRDKLMEDIGGVPLLLRQTKRALATGANVLVTTRADRPARINALEGTGAHLVMVDNPSEGIAASLRAGIAALPNGTCAVMILLPDLPDIDSPDMQAMLDARAHAPGRILRAVAEDGTPGHPTLFPAHFFPQLAQVTGDAGASLLIREAGYHPIPLQGARAITDLDTPEAWDTWRALHK